MSSAKRSRTSVRSEIALVLRVFHLTPRELARALQIAPYTVARWQAGTSTPTGLANEVMHSLYEAARFLNTCPEQARAAQDVGSRLAMGLGHILFTALTDQTKPFSFAALSKPFSKKASRA